MQFFRASRLYNRTDSAGVVHHGIFDVGRTKFHEDLVLHDPSDPLIPGTNVRRITLIPLAGRVRGATEDEVQRVGEELQHWAQQREPRKPAFTHEQVVKGGKRAAEERRKARHSKPAAEAGA